MFAASMTNGGTELAKSGFWRTPSSAVFSTFELVIVSSEKM